MFEPNCPNTITARVIRAFCVSSVRKMHSRDCSSSCRRVFRRDTAASTRLFKRRARTRIEAFLSSSLRVSFILGRRFERVTLAGSFRRVRANDVHHVVLVIVVASRSETHTPVYSLKRHSRHTIPWEGFLPDVVCHTFALRGCCFTEIGRSSL